MRRISVVVPRATSVVVHVQVIEIADSVRIAIVTAAAATAADRIRHVIVVNQEVASVVVVVCIAPINVWCRPHGTHGRRCRLLSLLLLEQLFGCL